MVSDAHSAQRALGLLPQPHVHAAFVEQVVAGQLSDGVLGKLLVVLEADGARLLNVFRAIEVFVEELTHHLELFALEAVIRLFAVLLLIRVVILFLILLQFGLLLLVVMLVSWELEDVRVGVLLELLYRL